MPQNRKHMVLDSYLLQWLVLGLLIWVVTLTIFLVRSILHYSRLTRNVTKKDLKTVLTEILGKVDLNQEELKTLNNTLKEVEKKMQFHIQKIGFIRFNPFSQTGGDQSFCLSLLDEKDSGFVLSSLHSRDTTRFYAKTIKNGLPEDSKLSEEEKKAIKIAK
jgi:cell division protein FtsB